MYKPPSKITAIIAYQEPIHSRTLLAKTLILIYSFDLLQIPHLGLARRPSQNVLMRISFKPTAPAKFPWNLSKEIVPKCENSDCIDINFKCLNAKELTDAGFKLQNTDERKVFDV